MALSLGTMDEAQMDSPFQARLEVRLFCLHLCAAVNGPILSLVSGVVLHTKSHPGVDIHGYLTARCDAASSVEGALEAHSVASQKPLVLRIRQENMLLFSLHLHFFFAAEACSEARLC